MPRRVIVKPLEQIDVTRMVLTARKHLYEKERAVNQTSFGLGYYRRMASLDQGRVKVYCVISVAWLLNWVSHLPRKAAEESRIISLALGS